MVYKGIKGIVISKGIKVKSSSKLILIIALELILLSIGILYLNFSFLKDDLSGALITLYLLPLAGAESAIALAILIAYYPKRGTLSISG